MDGVLFGTSFGKLHLAGRIHADPDRPVLLTVGGAFPPKDLKHDLVDLFPEASVLICRYPGMHCEVWDDPSPRRVAAAVDEFIGGWLKDRRIVAYGISTGCLVTLNLRRPEIRHQVAQEPFLTTSHMTPFIQHSRELLALQPQSEALKVFLWTVFGITETELQDRDYRTLVADPTLPLDLIVGSSEPANNYWPSFTQEEDRRILLDRPRASIHVAHKGTGHYVEPTPQARAMVKDCLALALESARGDRDGGRTSPTP